MRAVWLISLTLLSFAAQANVPAPPSADAVPGKWRLDPAGHPISTQQAGDLFYRHKILSALVDVPGAEIKQGVALAIINAPPVDVLRVLRDYPHFQEFMPYVASAKIDEHVGNRWLVSYVIKGPLGIGDREYQMEVFDEKDVDDGVETLVSRFQYTGKGNIKDTRGTWHLVPIHDGAHTFVRYVVRTDPGGSFPGWLKNRIASSGLPRVIEAVRRRLGNK